MRLACPSSHPQNGYKDSVKEYSDRMARAATLSRKVFVEALGAFILVFIGVGSILAANYLAIGNGISQLVVVAMAHGLALAIAVTIAMGISGGHINPAVTLGFLAARRIGAGEALAYIVFQVLGATVAGLLIILIMPASLGIASNWGVPSVSSLITVPQAIAGEAVITFFLMLAVYGTAVSKNAPRIGGLGIGFMLAADIMAMGPFTGAAANPARALGPAIASMNFTNWYVYWIGPIIGAVLAALICEYVVFSDRK